MPDERLFNTSSVITSSLPVTGHDSIGNTNFKPKVYILDPTLPRWHEVLNTRFFSTEARLLYIITISDMVCRKRGWHSTVDCEISEQTQLRQFKKLKSDLFNTHQCEIPALQTMMSDYPCFPKKNSNRLQHGPQLLRLTIPSPSP